MWTDSTEKNAARGKSWPYDGEGSEKDDKTDCEETVTVYHVYKCDKSVFFLYNIGCDVVIGRIEDESDNNRKGRNNK